MPYSDYLNQYHPYTQMYPPVGTPQRPQSNLIWVNGYEGAKAYRMTPNSNVLLLDSSEPYAYLKSTDAANFPTIERFKIEKDPIIETPVATEVAYATHEEVSELSSKIDQLTKMLEDKQNVDMMGVIDVQSNIQQSTTAASNQEPHYEQARIIQSSNDRGYQSNL